MSLNQRNQKNVDNQFIDLFNDNYIIGGKSKKVAIDDALATMGKSANDISDYILKAADSADEAGIKFKALGTNAKVASFGMKLLTSAMNVGVMLAINAAVTLLVKGIDAAVTTQKELEEEIQNTKTKLSDTTNELEAVNEELDRVRESIEALESKGAILTLAEEKDLENLRESNKELLLRQKLLEQQKQAEASKLSVDQMELFDRTLGNKTNRNLQSNLNDYEAGLRSGRNHIVGLTAAGLQENSHDYAALIAAYKYNEELKNVLDITHEEYQDITEINNEIAEVLNNQLAEAIEIRSTLNNLPDDQVSPAHKDAIELIDQFEQMYWNAIDPTGWMEIQFNDIFNDSQFSDVKERLIELSEQGNLTKESLKSLAGDVSFNALVSEFAKVGIDVDRIIAEISAKYPQGTTSSTSAPSFEVKSSGAFINSEKYNTIIGAIEAQNEAGTVSVELYKELVAIDEDLVEMLEATSEGYILNTEALYEYIEAQDEMLRLDAIGAIEDLQNQLDNTDLSLDEQDSIKRQIGEWELLIYEIENATGALAKWKTANKTANQDSAFNEGESMYDVLKEGNKTGKTGTDDFQSAVDFMLGENWESRIGADFKDLYDAYAQAEKNARKYFGQSDERTGMKNFANDLVENEFASWGKDAQDNKVLNLAEGLNIDDVAAELKMSEDAIKSLFKLMEAYGADFEWDFFLSDDDLTKLDTYKDTVEALEETKKKISEEKANLTGFEEGSEEYKVAKANIEELEATAETLQGTLEQVLSGTDQALTLDEALTKISELQVAIDTLVGAGINVPVALTGQYDKLQEIINTILGGTETENGGYTFEVTGVTDAADKLAQIQTVMQYVKKNPEIAAHLNDNFVSQLSTAESQLQAIVDSGEDGKEKSVTITLFPNDETTPKIEEIVSGNAPVSGTEQSEDGYGASITIKYQKDEESYQQLVSDIADLIEERTVNVKVNVEDEEDAIEDLLNKMNVEQNVPAVAMPDENGNYSISDIEKYVEKLFEGVSFEGKGSKEIFKEVMEKIAKDMANGLVIPAEEAIGEIDPSVEDRSIDNSVSTKLRDLVLSEIDRMLDSSDSGEAGSSFNEAQSEKFEQKRQEAESILGEQINTPVEADMSQAEVELEKFKNKAEQGVIVPIGGGAGINTTMAYAKGTQGAAGGLSLVDDGKGANAGPELIEHTSRGTFELGAGNGPRLTMLDKGDVVHTAKETKSILKRLAKVGGFFRNGINKGKSLIGKAFATGVSGSMVWTDAINAISKTSSSSKSKAKKSSNWKKQVEKLFDWIEIRLERLQTATDKWVLSASNAIGYAAKNANLDNALENTRVQVQETTAAYERYLKQANTIQKKTGLSNSIVKRIQEGTIDISSYSDSTQEKIKAYQEWYEKAVDCVDALTELKEQERELAQEKLDNILNHYQWRIDRLDAVIDKMQETIDLKAVTGVEVVESDYEKALEATKDKIEELNKSRETLAAEFKSLIDDGYIQEGSEEWNNYTSELEDLDQTIIETKIDLQDLKDAVDKIALTNLDYVISGLEQYAEAIQGMMGLHEAQGSDHKDTDYEALIRNGMEQIENLERQNEILKDQQKNLDINSEKYQEIQEQIASNNNTILDMKIAQEEWNDAVIDLKIQELQKYQDELQKINDKFQDQKDLQQAIEDLERARTQRTQRVYREGIGFVFEADQEELKNAQENLESVVHDQLLGKIDDLIDALDKAKDDTNVYDAAGNLLGKEYTLPNIENISALIGNTGVNSSLNGLSAEEKKMLYQQILGGAKGQNISVSIGDIVLEGVEDPNALANAIVDQFSNAVSQAIYSKV